MLADLESLNKRQSSIEKKAKSGDKEAKLILEVIFQIIAKLENGIPIRELDFSKETSAVVKQLNLLTSKPVLFVANVDENSSVKGNNYSDKLTQLGISKGIKTITMSAKLESEISEISDKEERKEFLTALNLIESGLEKLTKAGYDLLDLITYFTAGPKEVSMDHKKGTIAKEAAGKIHNDFSKGFIAAETISFNDYIKLEENKKLEKTVM